MFRPRVFVVLQPECVEHVLKTRFHNYVKGPRFHERMAELLGHGIFNVDGPRWYEQRKVSSHLFTHQHFKQGGSVGQAGRQTGRQAGLADGSRHIMCCGVV